MCIGVLPACVPVHCAYAWFLQRPEEDVRYFETGVKDGRSCHMADGN